MIYFYGFENIRAKKHKIAKSCKTANEFKFPVSRKCVMERYTAILYTKEMTRRRIFGYDKEQKSILFFVWTFICNRILYYEINKDN